MENQPTQAPELAQALRAPTQAKSPFSALGEMPASKPYTPPAMSRTPVPRFGGSPQAVNTPTPAPAPQPPAAQPLPSFFAYQPAPEGLFNGEGANPASTSNQDLIMRAPPLQAKTQAVIDADARAARAKAAAAERARIAEQQRNPYQYRNPRIGSGGQTEGGGVGGGSGGY